MTAKIVIASANRAMPVLQRWRSRKRIAEISVPAWPMPTQNTKLTMSKPQPTGWLTPQTPEPFAEGHRRCRTPPMREHRERDAEGDPPRARREPVERRGDDRIDLGRRRACPATTGIFARVVARPQCSRVASPDEYCAAGQYRSRSAATFSSSRT